MSVSNISHESHHFREVHNFDGWLKVLCLYVKNKICGGCNSTAVFSDKHTHICISVSEMCNKRLKLQLKTTLQVELRFWHILRSTSVFEEYLQRGLHDG